MQIVTGFVSRVLIFLEVRNAEARVSRLEELGSFQILENTSLWSWKSNAKSDTDSDSKYSSRGFHKLWKLCNFEAHCRFPPFLFFFFIAKEASFIFFSFLSHEKLFFLLTITTYVLDFSEKLIQEQASVKTDLELAVRHSTLQLIFLFGSF